MNAVKRLNAGIQEALTICSDEYTKMQALERREYARLQEVIRNFQNENMAAEQSRMSILAEEQRRENEVVKVRREYDSKYELVNREFESKLAAAKADIERNNIEHANHVSEIREQHESMMQGLRNAQQEQLEHKDNEIQALKKQLDTAHEQIKTLTENFAKLDSRTNEKYKERMDDLKNDRDIWVDKSTQVENLHKYTDKIKLTAMLIGVIAALGLGIIIGCAIITNTYNKQNNNAPTVNYYTDAGERNDNASDDNQENQEDQNAENSGEADNR